MSSHEMFMSIYANDRMNARLNEAQAYRLSKVNRRPSKLAAAWRGTGRVLDRAARALLAWKINHSAQEILP